MSVFNKSIEQTKVFRAEVDKLGTEIPRSRLGGRLKRATHQNVRQERISMRPKADALETRGAGHITLAAETVALMASALRFLATEGMAERRPSYSVEVWDASGNHIVEHIGTLSNHAAARAAFTAVCEARPNHEVTLRQGIRVVTRRGLDEACRSA